MMFTTNRKKPYTGIDIEVIPVEMKGNILVGSYGRKVVNDSNIQATGQEVTINDLDAPENTNPFKFTWD